MLRTLTILSASCLLLVACGDDDDDQGSAEAFCAEFATQSDLGVGVFDTAAVTETFEFLATLEAVAPPEIESDVSTVVEELDVLVDAMAEFEGVEGQEAVEAIQEAGDVDLDALAQSASAVGEYAAANCDDVEADPEG